MKTLLVIAGILTLIIGAQLIVVELASLSSRPHDSQAVGNYEPPNYAGPDSSMGSGTR